MKPDKETNRQYWNSQQQILRVLLLKDRDFQKALPVFLNQHAMVHTARLHPGDRWSCQDEFLDGLSEAQLRSVPKGCPHSAVWLLWHITRIEDVTMNILLADAQQLLHEGKWIDLLGTPYEGMGNELSPEEIAEISQAIHVKALLDYRLAVGERTRELVRSLNPEILWTTPDPECLKRLSVERAVSEKARWLMKYWGKNPSANLLLMPATRHCFLHLNEIQRMLPKLRRL